MVGGALGAANCRNVHVGVTLMNNFSEKVSFIWGVEDLLRGDYKQSEYGRVMLPFLVLRRLDQVLAPTRDAPWGPRRVVGGLFHGCVAPSPNTRNAGTIRTMESR